MNKKSAIINIDEVRTLFKEDCEEDGEKFIEKNFQDFIKFLEIDFYDWVKENLREFYRQ